MIEVKQVKKNRIAVNRFKDCMIKNYFEVSYRWKMHAKHALGSTLRSRRNSYYPTC